MTTTPSSGQALADAVLALHVGVVAFVVLGLVLILVGGVRHWRWVRGWTFRLAHLAAIAIVVAESWLGIECPLTTLERVLRATAAGTDVRRRLDPARAAVGAVLHGARLGLHHDLFGLRPAGAGDVVAGAAGCGPLAPSTGVRR